MSLLFGPRPAAAPFSFEWRAPAPQFARAADGWRLLVPGFESGQAGAPPSAARLLVMPLDWRYDILESEALVPPPGWSGPSSAPPPLQLQAAGQARDTRLARLVFSPLQPDGHGGWRIIRRVRLQLSAAAAAAPESDYARALAAAVVNPAQQPAPAAARALAAPAAAHAPAVIVEVTQPGLTALNFSDLAAAGLSLPDPAFLHLEQGGQEVALEIDSERAVFYAQPRFSPYTARDGYTAYYAAGAPGRRMPQRAAPPAGQPDGSLWATQVFETNALYMPEFGLEAVPPTRLGDRWLWDVLRQPDRSSAEYSFTLTGLSPSQPADIGLWLIGYTSLVSVAPDHQVRAALNGYNLGSVEWDGQQAITATLSAPAGILQNGLNRLQLSLSGAIFPEGVWLDAFSVRYALTQGAATQLLSGQAGPHRYSLSLPAGAARLYDVSDPAAPVRLTGLAVTAAAGLQDVVWGDDAAAVRYLLAAEILAPGAVRRAAALTPPAGADYLLLTPTEFASAFDPLLALRQSQGLSVYLQTLPAIYDTYDDGRPTPAAIKAFLQAAYDAWNPRPLYVLLAGDGTYDPRQYRANSAPTYLPPFLADVDPRLGETAADNRYATLAGADLLPDVLLGRLPLNSLAEAQALVAKLTAYETTPAPFAWNTRLVLVAGLPDSQYQVDFSAQSEAAAALIRAPFQIQRLYSTSAASETVKSALRPSAEWAAGLVMYTGHASEHQWSAERLFHYADVSSLNNGLRLPVVLEMTCFTGQFQLPGLSSLDEALLRQPNGGALAVWGATGTGYGLGHDQLARGFLQAVYGQRQPGLGAATLAGKLALLNSDQHLDLLDTFVLLGDPATQLNLNLAYVSHELFLPYVAR